MRESLAAERDALRRLGAGAQAAPPEVHGAAPRAPSPVRGPASLEPEVNRLDCPVCWRRDERQGVGQGWSMVLPCGHDLCGRCFAAHRIPGTDRLYCTPCHKPCRISAAIPNRSIAAAAEMQDQRVAAVHEAAEAVESAGTGGASSPTAPAALARPAVGVQDGSAAGVRPSDGAAIPDEPRGPRSSRQRRRRDANANRADRDAANLTPRPPGARASTASTAGAAADARPAAGRHPPAHGTAALMPAGSKAPPAAPPVRSRRALVPSDSEMD